MKIFDMTRVLIHQNIISEARNFSIRSELGASVIIFRGMGQNFKDNSRICKGVIPAIDKFDIPAHDADIRICIMPSFIHLNSQSPENAKHAALFSGSYEADEMFQTIRL